MMDLITAICISLMAACGYCAGIVYTLHHIYRINHMNVLMGYNSMNPRAIVGHAIFWPAYWIQTLCAEMGRAFIMLVTDRWPEGLMVVEVEEGDDDDPASQPYTDDHAEGDDNEKH